MRKLVILFLIAFYPAFCSGQVEMKELSTYDFLDSIFFNNQYESIIAMDSTFEFGLMMDYKDIDMSHLKKVPKSYIEDISYLQPGETATELFGEAGSRGAIIITTKDSAQTNLLFRKPENER